MWKWVDHGKNGYIIMQSELEKFEEYLDVMYRNSHLRALMREASLQVAKQFTVQTMTDQTEALYRMLLSNKSQ